MSKKIKDILLHVSAIIIVVVAEIIGTHQLNLGSVSILLLPMLYAVAFGLAMYFTPVIKKKDSKKAESMVFLAVALLVAKFGAQGGPAITQIIEAGPALILQELGNVGTVIISLPIAILLGLKRETIGMTFSTGREGSLALITEKYGIDSPEGRGVMAMYIFGTIFGAIFFSIFSGIIASIIPLSPLSYAMATGVGSGSMTAAAVGPLVEMFPDKAATISAFSGVSNLLTTVTGLYMSIFIALPLTEKYYAKVTQLKDSKSKKLRRKHDEN